MRGINNVASGDAVPRFSVSNNAGTFAGRVVDFASRLNGSVTSSITGE
jgi:hypothetical protein